MLRNYKILVVEDDTKRGEQLKLILDFIGEPCVLATSKNWDKLSVKEHWLGTLLAVDEQDKSIQDKLTHTPIVLTGDQVHCQRLSLKYPRNVVSTIALPLNYAVMLNALHRCQISQENNLAIDNEGMNQPVSRFKSLVGQGEGIKKVRQLIEHVASTDANVLIFGESGTGKEVAALNIHQQSTRKDGPFIPINCGAIPGELLESELFGHEKGAFTGAVSQRKGRFEMAQGGTLFLDEIGDMPLSRVLQERCFERVGSNKSIASDVRIIAATHRNLELAIKSGEFREDLFYRLNVFPIVLPPLRQRVDDIPLLVMELVARMKAEGRASVSLTSDAIDVLKKYPWPGNVRELANLVERLSILYPDGIVDRSELPQRFKTLMSKLSEEESKVEIETLPDIIANITEGIDLKQHLEETELSLIRQALERHDWVVARAASYLNMRRTTLVEKMKKYQLTRPEKAE